MEKFDAIVVGAGPAGSTAAYRLARSGAKVLLLDRARFPRDKPCGGGLTERAVTQLPVSVDPVVEEVVDRFELGFRYGTRFVRGGERPLVLMTRRSRLDAHLVAEAAAAGADFRDGLRATALNLDEAGATVRFDGTAASAPVVIGADGVNGLTARALGFGDRRHGVALEGNVSYAHAREDRWRGPAVVDLGAVPGGYAWVFPKGDHVNVGVGGWASEGPRLREHLQGRDRDRGHLVVLEVPFFEVQPQAIHGHPRGADLAEQRQADRAVRLDHEVALNVVLNCFACRCVGRARLRSAAERCSWVTRRASSTRSPETGSTRRY